MGVGRGGRSRYENATTPQLFASNEASRDIFQPVRHSLSAKRLPRRFRDRRRRAGRVKEHRARGKEGEGSRS